MKTRLLSLLLAVTAARLAAFDWPGGTMNVPVVFRGEEVFAGWVPSSPWGSTPFLFDPVVELRDPANNVIAEYTVTGLAVQWYEGGTREATAVFTVPAGAYTLTTREGRRLIRISGEGWSGFRMSAESVTAPVPPNSAPTIAWLLAPADAAHGQNYTVSARGHDDDGNLVRVQVWKNGAPFAFAGGGNGTDGDSGNTTSDAGPQSVTFTAQAADATGATSALISHTVTIAAPAPMPLTLNTTAGPGGTVSPGGTFPAGTPATVTALPDAGYDFSGWSGDAAGTVNPVTVLMDRDRNVQANFSLRLIPLVTGANAGGSVTGGGSYPYGSVVTVAAMPDSTHRFTGWTGDAGGSTPTVALTLTGPKSVQAVFADKFTQSITFAAPASQPAGGPPLTLTATATSGLPVTYAVLSGPAVVSGDQLQITGPGAVTVQASQAGDSDFLPAAATRTINAWAAAVLKYRPATRTLLRQRAGQGTAPYVIERP